ncbi:hypothetical protein NUACC21_35240 [Scytonema sp. NUACC21]
MTTFTIVSQQLKQVTTDLHHVNPWAGLLRFSILGFVFLSLVALAWSVPSLPLFVSLTTLAGVFYAFWLVSTHDMTHKTLTGWTWFDSLMPRLISWPMLWPHSLYAEMHRLHHAWNGIDFRDPERVQWTWQEYQQVHPLLQWYVRYQWVSDIFVLGGIGLIIKTFIQALRFRKLVSGIWQQMLLDLTGMLVVHAVLLIAVISQGELLRYLLFWLILERVIGIIVQTRDHLEHYALWGRFTNHQLTQLYSCRNLKTSFPVGWLMGGLNYHAVHHAFPDIPFNQLPAAFLRIQEVLQQHGLPLMELEAGYINSTYLLSCYPSLIGEVDSSDATGRHHMIPVKNSVEAKVYNNSQVI